MGIEALRAQGERELAERLLTQRPVIKAMEKAEEAAERSGARRHLLATAMRLTPEMAPDLARIMRDAAEALELSAPLETFVFPSPQFNAAAVRPEQGRMFIVLSSSLLEAFDPDELSFVVGHELGHHVFDHHRIPVGVLLSARGKIGPSLALQLFAWQRYAEVSCDRAGVVAARGLGPAATALFKLASGLSGDRVEVKIEHFIAQLGDLRDEARRLDRADSPARSDWFSTHPFSPLRLRAAALFAESELLDGSGTPVAHLEAEVHELMTLMDPSYLQAKSEIAEAMRRLLFAGGILIAAASGEISKPELNALEELLGPGSVPGEINPDAVREALPRRIAAVNEQVPSLRRVQIVRDLCLVARADDEIIAAEHDVIDEIARGIGVECSQIETFLEDCHARAFE